MRRATVPSKDGTATNVSDDEHPTTSAGAAQRPKRLRPKPVMAKEAEKKIKSTPASVEPLTGAGGNNDDKKAAKKAKIIEDIVVDDDIHEFCIASQEGETSYSGRGNSFSELAASEEEVEEEEIMSLQGTLLSMQDVINKKIAAIRQKQQARRAAEMAAAAKKNVKVVVTAPPTPSSGKGSKLPLATSKAATKAVKVATTKVANKSAAATAAAVMAASATVAVSTAAASTAAASKEVASTAAASTAAASTAASTSKGALEGQQRGIHQKQPQVSVSNNVKVDKLDNKNKNKKEKVPPINVYKMLVRDTIDVCEGTIGKNFKVKRINNDLHAIHCSTVDAHHKIKELLKEANTDYYTYTPKCEKFHTVLLKGIEPTSEPADILNELRSLSGDDLDFVEVKPFTTARSRREGRKLPIFLVQLAPNSKLDRLRSITVLSYQVVTWDKIKRRGDISQCMRCQRFGHATSNCEMQPRCVKCGENHNSKYCTLGEQRVEDKTLLRCILCGNSGHPANYRGCPKFQAIKNKKVPAKEIVERRSTTIPTTTPVTARVSFAQMVSGQGKTVQNLPKVAPKAPVPQAPVPQAPVSRAPEAEGDLKAILLAIQGQLNSLQDQMRRETERVDRLYELVLDQVSNRSMSARRP